MGIGFGDANSIPDIIWQNMGDRTTAVWLMGGADGSEVVQPIWNPTTVPSWRLVGVADFNSDDIADVLWENETDPAHPVGTRAVYYMNNNWAIGGTAILNTPPTPTQDGWTLMTIGDYGRVQGGTALADGIQDGVPDLVIQHFSTGLMGLWILKPGGELADPQFGVQDLAGNFLKTDDPEWKVLGTADFGGTTGPYSDFVFRSLYDEVSGVFA